MRQKGGNPINTGESLSRLPLGTPGLLHRAHPGGARKLRLTPTNAHPQLDTSPCAREGLRQGGGPPGGPLRQVALSSSPRGAAQRASLLGFEEPLSASASTALLLWVLENNCLPQSLWGRSLGQPGGQARSFAGPGTPALGTWHVFN